VAENKFFQENAFIALEQNNSMSFLRQRIMFKTIWYKPRRYSLSFYIDILFSEYKKMVYTDMHIGIINILFGKINITTSCFIRFKTKNVLYRLVRYDFPDIRDNYRSVKLDF